jgi:VCBS repeat-containing protein
MKASTGGRGREREQVSRCRKWAGELVVLPLSHFPAFSLAAFLSRRPAGRLTRWLACWLLFAASGQTSFAAAPTDITLSASSINEGNAPNAAIGSFSATDPDAGDTHTFALIAGAGSADNGSFTITSAGGVFTLRANSTFNFETKSSYSIRVRATDAATNTFEKALTITVNDVNEGPTIANQTLEVDENSAVGAVVGTVTATDPDGAATPNGTLTYAITSAVNIDGQNSLGVFAINARSGQITVASTANSALDFEQFPTYTLVVRVSDGGAPSLNASANVVINLRDKFSVANQSFTVSDDASVGTLVGTIQPTDPGTLTFSITGGNVNDVFSMPGGRADLIVAKPIDFVTTPTYNLTVQVSGGGTTVNITVTITARPGGFNVPTGSPVLVEVPGSGGRIPVRGVAFGSKGDIYLIGENSSGGSLIVFPPGLDSSTNVLLGADFSPRAIQVASDSIYVGGYNTSGTLNGHRVIYRVLVTDLSAISSVDLDAASGLTGTINDLELGRDPNGVQSVYVCGKTFTAAGVSQHYWQRLERNLVARNGRSWGFGATLNATETYFTITPDSLTPAGAPFNGEVYAIAVDPNGDLFVSGNWQDPSPTRYSSSSPERFGYLVQVSQTGLEQSGGFTLRYRANPEGTRNGYIAKFNGATGVNTSYAQDSPYETASFITDMRIITLDSGDVTGTFLYTLQHYYGKGQVGGETFSTGFDFSPIPVDYYTVGGVPTHDIKINRFNLNLAAQAPQNALIRGFGDEQAISFTSDEDGNIYLTGIANAADVIFQDGGSSNGKTVTPAKEEFFVARLNNRFSWDWIRRFDLGTYNANSAYALWYPQGQKVIVAGNIDSGTLTLTKAGKVNSVVASGGQKMGFVTLVDNEGEFVERLFLEIISEFGLPEQIKPFKGKGVGVLGATYTAEVPPILYVRADGTYLTLPATEDQIERFAVTRYVNTGYTVENTEIIGDSSSYTFIFKENTTLTFHWTVEHALEIKTDLGGTGATNDPVSGEWFKNATNNLGLTSTAAGMPEPLVKKHWIKEDELATATIDGATLDFSSFGTRYIVTGFRATGSARVLTNNVIETNLFSAVETRQQAPQFAMKEPATITWQWGVQHRVQVSTSNPRAADYPGIKVSDTSGQQDRIGSGEFWFNRGTAFLIGARDVDNSLNGALLTTGDLSGRIPNKAALNTNFVLGAHTYLAVAVSSLSQGTVIAWDYGDPIYKETVKIGDPVLLYGTLASNLPPAIAGDINTNKAPRPRVIESPPGSTGPDMNEWDEVAHRAYPVRPGRYFLDWEKVNTRVDADGNALDLIILEITSEFPAVPHYRHLTHPEQPPVNLDPDPQDNMAFLKMEYATADAVVAGNNFTAIQNGKTVFLFSRSESNAVPFVPAVGNRLRETLAVKVVETMQWNEGPNGYNTNTPAIKTYIGTKARSASDTAGIGTGFIIYTNACYNGNIYDRSKVADAGPVIPVNRHFRNDPTHDLVIVWYERVDGLLWPYKTERFDPQWPVPLNPAALPSPLPDPETMFANGTNYLRRIVIASRLGSEGKDHALRDQISFSQDRYELVSLYNQPNPNLTGYNPNEEHALIAPSFKFLDQATPPPTAYALRNDYNVTNHDATYTSDPLVLVQFLDKGTNGGPGEFKMAVYAIEHEDDRPSLNPYRYPVVDPDPSDPNDQREFPYVFHYPMKAGEPVQPPYPLGLVIGLTPCKQTYGENITAQRVYWEDHRGGPWAVSAGDFRGYFYYPLLDTFWAPNPATVPGTCLPFVTAAEVFLTSQASNTVFDVGSQFTVNGATVTLTTSTSSGFVNAVNALGGDVRAELLSAGELRLRSRSRSTIRLVDGAGSPLSKAGFDVRAAVVGTTNNPVFASSDQFTLNGIAITVNGTNAAAFAQAVNTSVPDIVAFVFNSGAIELRSPTLSRFTLTDGAGGPLAKAGLRTGTIGHDAMQTRAVQFTAVWPDKLPILKLGETLTFAGGEYKADNPSPDQPGLPGVVGWVAGEVIFDSLNPKMDNKRAFTDYTARLITPLEERTVTLTEGQANSLTELIQPATGVTRVNGTRWFFRKLPASLGKRVFYDPIARRLGLKGFLNDKTLGDSSLTATPPPVYVLEPNILTPREYVTLRNLVSLTAWRNAVDQLYALGRNPNGLRKSPNSTADTAAYYVGLETDVIRDANGDPIEDAGGHRTPLANSAAPLAALGPGLALVPSPMALDPDAHFREGYVTLVENNNPDVGGPISLFIIKLSREFRYRGAIKTILSDNVFDEAITLRHSGDFGGNADDLVYQWFYREEDGTVSALPPPSPWKIFPDQSDNPIRGLGLYQISLEGSGGLLLADNLFFVRYRHKDDVPAAGNNSQDWTGTEWERFGRFNVDGDGHPVAKVGSQWAGAANSPTVDGEYKPQLAQGWLKRVLDRVNPYEARFNDFRNNPAPATYVSMIQQAGQRFEGPVALNPDKNVIENVGLIELYSTLLQRGRALSIDLSSPIVTPGINNALLLAATRLSDLHMLLGNEAYADAQDQTTGFGSDSAEFGSAAASIFAFKNQQPSLLEEELALLRGVPTSYGRPVYNRLFWNFTKSEGEMAYVLTYGLTDINRDGFVDENDARLLYPQGHGDAWGHYLTAVKSHYTLLRHRFFNWVSRAESYNLLDVVIDVDFLDERKFADAAAARAKAGAEILNLTYRSRYVEDPDGQWQGYSDTDPDRAWGVDGWARRAGQGAYFDWVMANALIPAVDSARTGLQKIDRSTVRSIGVLASQLGEMQVQYDNANNGLNPLGLASDVVPFDIDATFNFVGSTAQIGRPAVQGLTHFKQIYERAVAALNNAASAWDHANQHANRIRQVGNTADSFAREVEEQDRDFRNRLIEVFGTPYEGTIGPGQAYPSGYAGPDLMLFMYVDVRDVNNDTVPPASSTFTNFWKGFPQQVLKVDAGSDGKFVDTINTYFINDRFSSGGGFDPTKLFSVTDAELFDNGILTLNLPATASSYVFLPPADGSWGRRASPGELQSIISDMVQAQADLALGVGDYDVLVGQIKDIAELLAAKHGVATEEIKIKDTRYKTFIGLNVAINTLKALSAIFEIAAIFTDKTGNAVITAIPGNLGVYGLANGPGDIPTAPAKGAILAVANTVHDVLESLKIAADAAADVIDSSKELVELRDEIEVDKGNFKFEIREKLKELEQALRNESTTRIEVFKRMEALRQIGDRYRAALQAGVRLIDERQAFNIKAAGVTQLNRYQDMAFRIFRNDALQKYKAAFDLAARYTYMAAKAYDYETNLSPDDRGSAQGILTEIVRARTLGTLDDGEPLLGGGGLSDLLAVMRDNFKVFEGQYTFNNPQFEENRISLRRELFRISGGAGSDATWRQTLKRYRVADLWQVPEFRRFCRPPAPRSAGPIPGLVIPFGTQVTFGKNFFGWPLGPGDHAYDPSVYASKIQSATIWFRNYRTDSLAASPRAYLVPAGLDVMTIPTSSELTTRAHNVVDQAIPVPFKTTASALRDPNWLPVRDSLEGPMTAIRRYASLRAYGDTETAPDEVESPAPDYRLIARSVWNTRWMIIIAGGTFLADGNEGLDTFIDGARVPGNPSARDLDGAKDILIFFSTYGYAGN